MKFNKKTIIGISVITLIITLSFTPKIFAAISENIPRVSTACESKAGLLMAAGDGYSIFKSCPAGSRRVVIVGEKGDKGDKGDRGIQGLTGLKGEQGIQGLIGPKGDTGLQGGKGEQGIQGLTGSKGDTGAAGTNGKDGVNGYEIVTGASSDSNPSMWKGSTAVCPTGKKVVGGGYNVSGQIIEIFVFDNKPLSDTTWKVAGYNKFDQSLGWSLQAYAICVNNQETTPIPTITPTPNPTTLETLQVSSMTPERVQSNTILEKGKNYLIEASGTFNYVPGERLADAEFWYNTDTRTWNEEIDVPPLGYNLDLMVNDLPQDWLGSSDGINYSIHTFSPNHIYRVYVQGDDKPISFYIHNSSYDWKQGSLTVSIKSL